MKEERMMILRMVDEGKINVDDGVKLLKAINKATDTEEKISKAASKLKTKMSDFAEEAKPVVKKAAHDLKVKSSEMADEIGGKIKAHMNRKDACDCEGDILEADDMEAYEFEFDEEEEKADAQPEEKDREPEAEEKTHEAEEE